MADRLLCLLQPHSGSCCSPLSCTGRFLTSYPRKATLLQEWPRHPWKIAGNFGSHDFHQFSPVILVLRRTCSTFLRLSGRPRKAGNSMPKASAKSTVRRQVPHHPGQLQAVRQSLLCAQSDLYNQKIKLKGRTDLALVSN